MRLRAIFSCIVSFGVTSRRVAHLHEAVGPCPDGIRDSAAHTVLGEFAVVAHERQEQLSPVFVRHGMRSQARIQKVRGDWAGREFEQNRHVLGEQAAVSSRALVSEDAPLQDHLVHAGQLDHRLQKQTALHVWRQIVVFWFGSSTTLPPLESSSSSGGLLCFWIEHVLWQFQFVLLDRFTGLDRLECRIRLERHQAGHEHLLFGFGQVERRGDELPVSQ